MIVKEMLDKISFDDIWKFKKVFLNENDEKDPKREERVKKGYKLAWDTLHTLTPIVDHTKYLICGEYFDFLSIDDEPKGSDLMPTIFTVSLLDSQDKTIYSMLLTKWEEILGWEVSDFCVRRYGDVRFAAYLLYEVTFFGVDYDEVKSEQKKLEDELEESTKAIESGEMTGIPFDDFMKEMGMQDDKKDEKEKTVKMPDKELMDRFTALNKEIEELIINNTLGDSASKTETEQV